MQLSLFDLNLLKALDALLTEKSVTRAADRLHVTQQAMSGSLKRLREHFGDELLVRNGIRMEVTALGTALMIPVREVVLQIGQALDTTLSFNPVTTRRRFRISMSDYCAFTFLPLLMKRVLATAPGMVCDILPLNENAFLGLASGDLDVVLLPSFWRLQEADDLQGVRTLPLFEDDFVCAVDASIHTFDEMTLERYRTLPHTAVRLEGGHQTIIDDAWAMNQFTPRLAATTTGFSTLMFMIVGNPMVATVQRRMAQRFVDLLPIRLLECPIQIAPLSQQLRWHPRNDDDPAHAYIRHQIVAAAGDMDAAPTA